MQFALILILTMCTSLGIYTFHVKLTCRSSQDKKLCARNAFFTTIAIVGLGIAVVVLYHIHKTRQDDIDRLLMTD